MERRIAPIFVVTVTLLAVITMLAILKSTTRAGENARQSADPALSFSLEPDTSTSAGLSVDPARQGGFISAGSSVDFGFTIENTGDTLTDVFEIDIASAWPTILLQSDGTTPLDDSNGNGLNDTGTLLPGQTIYLFARISAPDSAFIGQDNRTTLVITSFNSPLIEETLLMQSAVPSSFLLAFREEGLNNPGIFVSQANNHAAQPILTPSGNGSEIAVAETVSGYAYVWSDQRLEGNIYVTEIESLLMDKQGNLISGSTKITDHSGALLPIHDIDPAIAVDPQGNIAISWQRLQFDQNWNVKNNVFFRIINREGSPIASETDLTNNTQWGVQNTIGVPNFESPRIAPMADSGFFAAWHHEHQETEGVVQDIFFATLDGSGGIVISPTNMTNDSPGGYGNIAPAITGLSTNRALISWVRRETENDDVWFEVIDNLGNVIHGPANLSQNEKATDWWNFDAIELSNGSIMVVWQAWDCIEGEHAGRIRFAVLGSNYQRIRQPRCMEVDGVATGGDRGVSVTADTYGNGIITWTDQDLSNRRNLYYALVNRRGRIVTEPLAFYHSDALDGPISLNIQGYASTSRAFIDGVAYFSDPLYIVQKGERVRLIINYDNMGTLASGAMTLTVDLDGNLVYVSDTAPVDPIIDGNMISWNFSNMEPFTETNQFDLYSTLPVTATIGATYPITLSVDLQLVESDSDNNHDLARVVVGQSLFLPLIAK
ncbi:MAG TPA: hypothetical protein VMZ24_07240 [Patescibacteria group bacterium]|nr:hypothetical protein [Patescibacteria group bacterium]